MSEQEKHYRVGDRRYTLDQLCAKYGFSRHTFLRYIANGKTSAEAFKLSLSFIKKLRPQLRQTLFHGKKLIAPTKTAATSLHWGGMPEYVYADVAPVLKLIVNFDSLEAVEEFSKLVEQKITVRTRSIYFPFVEKQRIKSGGVKRYYKSFAS